MKDFDLFAGPQGRAAAPRWLKITASAGADLQLGPQPLTTINFVGSADFCRPRS